MKRRETVVTNQLIGKAGVGLAMFHLGRLGYEFVPTTENSHLGDLWADFGGGPEIVEVKASFSGAHWALRREQAERVQWFCFVAVRDAACWLAPQKAIIEYWDRSHLSGLTSIRLSYADMERSAARAFHREVPPVCKPEPSRRQAIFMGEPRRWRVVKRTLADGQTKEYRYPIF